MEIKDKTIPFCDVFHGDVFKYNNELFIKLKSASNQQCPNSAYLCDGVVSNFTHNTEVTPVKGKFVED